MTDWRLQRWQLGASVLEAGQGGIARVARMTANAMISAGARCDIAALVDRRSTTICGVASRTFAGDQIAFGAAMHAAALRHDCFLYDAVGPARAHPRLPGLRRFFGIWIHGIEVWDALSPDRRRALMAADFILANSVFTLDRFTKLHGPLRNAHVCPLATEEDHPLPRPTSDRRPQVLMLGRMAGEEMYKGQLEMIDCWPAVVARVPEARLVIAGGGSGVDMVRARAAASPASKFIEITGFAPDTQIDALWRESRVFALPSRGEGFGIVYIEAMRHGLPIIASIHDAGQEVNVHGETGFNVDQANRSALAEHVVLLLRNTELATSFGLAGQNRWMTYYRFSHFRDRLQTILGRVCAA